jgi:hypothetical protein
MYGDSRLRERGRAATVPGPADAGSPGLVPRVLGLARRHVGLLVLLAVATAARVVVVAAYATALWFPDSGTYVRSGQLGKPAVDRPYGYSAFLHALDGLPFRYVAVVQHVLGLVAIVLVYALLQHRGVARWVSLLAVAPLALDAYVLDIEQFILAETLFMVLLAAAVAMLLAGDRPGPLVVGTAGVLMGALALTRTVGTALAGVLLVYLLVRVLLRTLRWTAPAAFAVGLAVTLMPYAAWFAESHGTYALTNYTGHFLYGRVADFVRCDELDVPPRLQPLCPSGPPEERPTGDTYVWYTTSPANAAPGGIPMWSEDDLEQFALIAIKGQPADYARQLLSEVWHYATPGRHSGPQDTCPLWWQFPQPTATPPTTCVAVLAPGPLAWRPFLVDALRSYQRVAYTPGPVLGLCVVAGLAALVVPGGAVRDRLDPALLATLGVALVAVPAATASFDYRYLLPTLVVLPAAAALATRRLPARTRSAQRTEADGTG